MLILNFMAATCFKQVETEQHQKTGEVVENLIGTLGSKATIFNMQSQGIWGFPHLQPIMSLKNSQNLMKSLHIRGRD